MPKSISRAPSVAAEAGAPAEPVLPVDGEAAAFLGVAGEPAPGEVGETDALTPAAAASSTHVSRKRSGVRKGRRSSTGSVAAAAEASAGGDGAEMETAAASPSEADVYAGASASRVQPSRSSAKLKSKSKK